MTTVQHQRACEHADAFDALLGAGRGHGRDEDTHPAADPELADAAPVRYTDRFGMAVTVHDVAYHRNGSGAEEGFFAVRFDWASERSGQSGREFLAVVFAPEPGEDGSVDFDPERGEPRVAVLSTGLLPDVGADNKWRGGDFTRCLYQALDAFQRGDR